MIAWLAILADYAIRLFFYASAPFATKLVMVLMAVHFVNVPPMLLLFVRFKRVRFIYLKSMDTSEGTSHNVPSRCLLVSQSGHGA